MDSDYESIDNGEFCRADDRWTFVRWSVTAASRAAAAWTGIWPIIWRRTPTWRKVSHCAAVTQTTYEEEAIELEEGP